MTVLTLTNRYALSKHLSLSARLKLTNHFALTNRFALSHRYALSKLSHRFRANPVLPPLFPTIPPSHFLTNVLYPRHVQPPEIPPLNLPSLENPTSVQTL